MPQHDINRQHPPQPIQPDQALHDNNLSVWCARAKAKCSRQAKRKKAVTFFEKKVTKKTFV
jgi:hypothetical protein